MCFSINRRYCKQSKYNLALLRPVSGACIPYTSSHACVGDTRAKGVNGSSDGPADGDGLTTKDIDKPSLNVPIDTVVHPGTSPLSDGCLTDDDSSSDSVDACLLTPGDAKYINFFSGETLEEEVKEPEKEEETTKGNLSDCVCDLNCLDKTHVPGVKPVVRLGQRVVANSLLPNIENPPATLKSSLDTEVQQCKEDSLAEYTYSSSLGCWREGPVLRLVKRKCKYFFLQLNWEAAESTEQGSKSDLVAVFCCRCGYNSLSRRCYCQVLSNRDRIGTVLL